MEAQIWSSELAICSNYYYTEKAWHLASILLLLRRPASPEELAARCSLFRTSPEFIDFLCSIPNSPICLTTNNFVVLSMSAFSAFGEFVASSMPKIEIRLCGGQKMLRTGDDLVRKCFRKRKKLGNEIMPVVKRRAVLRSVDENERGSASYCASHRIVGTCCEGVDLQIDPVRALSALSFARLPVNVVDVSDMVVAPSMVNSSIELLKYQQDNDGDQESENKHKKFEVNDMDNCVVMEELQDKCFANRTCLDLPNYSGKVPTDPLLKTLAGISAMLEDNHDVTNVVSRMDNDVPTCPEINQHEKNLSVESTAIIHAAKDFRHCQMPETKMGDLNEQPLMDNGSPEERVENILFASWGEIFRSVDKLCQTKVEISSGETNLKEQENVKPTSQPLESAEPQPSGQIARTKSSVLKNIPQAELTQKQKTPSKLMQHNKADIIHKEQKVKKHRITIAMMDKSKHIARNSASTQERRNNVIKSSKDQQKPKFPEFESYTVEEEEGSGGYGTVYRARRNTDGLTFAIKCPHANAQKHHVKNELKMLERFGGRNCVIRYEGSLKSESSDCFVLEHVAHDRPEVLKREIDISQLQWYGFCMFRALVSLHKQGVFHRDIKPGNFLYSCKARKGYLIDFNLARDVNQKQGSVGKPQPNNVTAIQHRSNSLGQFKPTSPNKRKKSLGAPESKTLKKKPVDKLKAYEDLGRCNPLTSQCADGSGITSARDLSTRTPSAEKLREPLPCKGRKALINIAQEAMQSLNHGAAKSPASNRKRVAASPGITDRKLYHPTPTPLHSSGIAICGAGSLKNRGEVKPNKDGACAGTKGFRAPEVLLRSLHQGPKMDVWSAGVTLLYLISGKMPFNGDPEQNMKDIVRLRGNEELWEVAKLHNRESSFPVELLDIRFLPSMTIRDWYLTNTKRQDLLGVIPDLLFDLLEKCLTVSPRLRITAEEALNHEFFAPCHDLHKHRLSRRGQNQDFKSNSLPLSSELVRPQKKLTAPVNF